MRVLVDKIRPQDLLELKEQTELEKMFAYTYYHFKKKLTQSLL